MKQPTSHGAKKAMARREGCTPRAGTRRGAGLSASRGLETRSSASGARRSSRGEEGGKSYAERSSFIPPDLDEDIDDDLAFNSDDEAMYGSFFQSSSKPKGKTKGTKGKSVSWDNDDGSDNDEALARLNALGRAAEATDDGSAPRRSQSQKRATPTSSKGAKGRRSNESSDDDDDDNSDSDGSYIDLSDMLDASPSAKKKKAIASQPTPVAKKAARRAKLTEEPESLLGPSTEDYGLAGAGALAPKKRAGAKGYANALETLLSVPDEAATLVKERLATAFQDRNTLLSTDMDEYAKETLSRKQERQLIAEEMRKYDEFLKEQQRSKHVAFPMRAPESNPVPSSLGAIVAASRKLQAETSQRSEANELVEAETSAGSKEESVKAGNLSSALSLLPKDFFVSKSSDKVSGTQPALRIANRGKDVATRLAQKTNSILAAAGLSAKEVAREADTGAAMEGLLGTGDTSAAKATGSKKMRKMKEDPRGSGPTAGVPRKEPVVSFGDEVKFDSGDADGANAEGEQDGSLTHGYMAKLKAMLAYEVNKRRRFNKIKSKTYRRLLRKEKDKEKNQREEVFALLHPQRARERLAKRLELDRARERLTQKHKNTSKWVKHIQKNKHLLLDGANGVGGNDLKDAINEQHLLHSMLMQKMEESAGQLQHDMLEHQGGDNSSSDDSDEDDRLVDELMTTMKGSAGATPGQSADVSGRRKAVESLLWKVIEEDEGADGGETGAGQTPMEKARSELKKMDFMKRATERKRESLIDEVNALVDGVQEYYDEQDEASSTEGGTSAAKKGKKVRANPAGDGAITAGIRAGAGRASFPEGGSGSRNSKKKEGETAGTADADAKRRGTIVFAPQSGISADGGVAFGVVGADSSGPSKVSGPPAERCGGEEDEEEHEVSSAASHKETRAKPTCGRSDRSEISGFAGDRGAAVVATKSPAPSTRVTILPSSTAKESKKAQKRARSENPVSNAGQGTALAADSELLEHQQEYLVSRAFANDEIDEDFLAQKQGNVEQIMKPRDANETLPGWGEWGGDSETNPALNQRHRERVQRIELERNIERQQLMRARADAHLDNVIINHDGIELVPDRFLLHMVPRPFSNAVEFTRSMRQPLGPEWSTAMLYKEGNQPRVTVQQGHSILPLDLSLCKKKKAKTTRRKSRRVEGGKGIVA